MMSEALITVLKNNDQKLALDQDLVNQTSKGLIGAGSVKLKV